MQPMGTPPISSASRSASRANSAIANPSAGFHLNSCAPEGTPAHRHSTCNWGWLASVASLKFVEEVIDLEEHSRCVIPARLSCLAREESRIAGPCARQPKWHRLPAGGSTGWKPVPLKRVTNPDCDLPTIYVALMLRTSDSGHECRAAPRGCFLGREPPPGINAIRQKRSYAATDYH